MSFKAREMKVEGEMIPKAFVATLIRRMKSKKWFRASDLREIAEAKMLKEKISSRAERPYIASRLVDRMIQRARKSESITKGTEVGKLRQWNWVG